jgi:uncharacterized protein YbjT (DUF2867 family)
MRILISGVTGYIGKRLLPVLLKDGHEIVCCVRDRNRIDITRFTGYKLNIIELDFLDSESLEQIPDDIDVAYYLIHSMSASLENFDALEERSARNFRNRMQETKVKQVIYLSGITNVQQLSKHLISRRNVEDILSSGTYHLTTLRAGIIVGSGSASFEIIRDLVEKLPVMVTPKWLNTKSQPIAIRNVLEYLKGVILREQTFDKSYDIFGPEVLTYKEMLLKFAKVRGLRRTILTIPVMTPRLSSYWLYFVTSTSYKLAINLVNSMKVEVIGRKNDLNEQLQIKLISYEDAIQQAFDKIIRKEVPSSWTDAQSSEVLAEGISNLIQVPTFGCKKDQRMREVKNEKQSLDRIWSIGGQKGWYFANWLWRVRGFFDKLIGGVGLRRGRRSPATITAGDSIDFWRVLFANKTEKRLLLFAEMKLPGEAWLEFKIRNGTLYQTATFRPLGVWGRIYWYALLPFHAIIFNGLLKKITE